MLKTVKLYLLNEHIAIISLLFLIWKIVLFLCLIFAFCTIPLKSGHFLGGGYQNYNSHPYLFPWLNYDGEHYLSIALTGYHDLEQAFFPLFPFLINFFLNFFPATAYNAAIIGLVLSNAAFLISLILIYNLILKNISRQAAIGTIITILVFPTSFFLQSYYTESLFLLSSVLTFYFYGREKYWFSGLSGIFATSTRIFGIILLPALFAEVILMKRKIRKFFPLLLIPFGLFFYMIYLWYSIGDPLGFYHQQAIFGEHRQQGITLYPQTLYRAVRIAFTQGIPFQEKVIYIQELIAGVLFLILPVYGFFKKLPVSWIVFSVLGFLLPTTVGSFSSLPRYILVLFPSFLILYLMVWKLPAIFRAVLFFASAILLCLNTVLFVRGYWVG